MIVEVFLTPAELTALQTVIERGEAMRPVFAAEAKREVTGQGRIIGYWIDIDHVDRDRLLRAAREKAPAIVPAVESAISIRTDQTARD